MAYVRTTLVALRAAAAPAAKVHTSGAPVGRWKETDMASPAATAMWI